MRSRLRSAQLRALLLGVVTILLTSGCLRVNLNVDVRDDGSAQLEGLAAINADLFASAFEGVGDGFGGSEDEFSRGAICDGFLEDEGIGGAEADIEPYEQDGFCGAIFTQEYSPAQLDELRGELDAGAVLRQDGDGWTFELPFSEDEFDSSEADAFGFDDVFADAEYIVRVRLPGQQADHNGDYIDSEGFVVWDLDVTNLPSEPLRLRTQPGETIFGSQAPPASSLSGGSGGGGIVTYLLIGVAVLAALAAAAWFFTKRKQDAPEVPLQSGFEPSGPSAPTLAGATAFAPNSPGAPVTPVAESPGETVIMQREPQPAAAPEALGRQLTPAQATEPTWDPARGSYVQWDPTHSRWLIYNDDTKSWAPEV